MLYDPQKLLLIAGPCSLENERVCRAVAGSLAALARAQPELKIVFKGSFDKANRTSGSGPRGPGLEAGLELLALVRRDYGFPVLTDVHEPAQVPAVAAVCESSRSRRFSAARPTCCSPPPPAGAWST